VIGGLIAIRQTIGLRRTEIDPQRPNAFKNLGIALAAQGHCHEAARAFVVATQVNAADPRAFRLLEDLVKQHPELEREYHDDIEGCRQAVAAAAKRVEELRPVVHRGWRKRLILLKMKLQSAWRRWQGGFQ